MPRELLSRLRNKLLFKPINRQVEEEGTAVVVEHSLDVRRRPLCLGVKGQTAVPIAVKGKKKGGGGSQQL